MQMHLRFVTDFFRNVHCIFSLFLSLSLSLSDKFIADWQAYLDELNGQP